MPSNALSPRHTAGRPPPQCKKAADLGELPRASLPLTLNCGVRYKDYKYPPTYPMPLFVKHLLWIYYDPRTGGYHGLSPFPEHPIEVWTRPVTLPHHWDFTMQIHISSEYEPYIATPNFFIAFYPDIDSRWNNWNIPELERYAGARITI